MQIDDGAQVVLTRPVEGIVQQVPCLGSFVSLLVPELYLVDGDAHEVETEFLQTGEVVLLDMQSTGLTTLLRLREPVTDIRTALDAEIVHLSCLILTLGLVLT